MNYTTTEQQRQDLADAFSGVACDSFQDWDIQNGELDVERADAAYTEVNSKIQERLIFLDDPELNALFAAKDLLLERTDGEHPKRPGTPFNA